MRVFDGIAEFEGAVGEHLGVSEWHTVTQEQIDLFADATGDHQWIHVDPHKAAKGPFGSTVAHGYLTVSLIPRLATEIFEVRGLRMAVNYGSNKVRFPSPVPADSRIRASAELAAVTRGSSGAQATVRVTVERDGSDKPACVAEVVSVLFD
jgi:acyl dehydratase